MKRGKRFQQTSQTVLMAAGSAWALFGCGGSDSNTGPASFRAQQLLVNNVAATDATTGQAIRILHVAAGGAGAGTYESPFSSVSQALAGAQPGDLIYVHASSGLSMAGFTVPAGVRVLSSAVPEYIDTKQGAQIKLPLSGSGTLPIVTSTVTLSNDTTLDGFNITPATGAGISGTDVTGNIAVNDNTVVVSDASGVSGIYLRTSQGRAYYTVLRNTVSNGSKSGILLQSEGTAIINANVSQNTATANTGSGIFFFVDNGQVTANVTGNTVSGNQGVTPLDSGIRFGVFNASVGNVTYTSNNSHDNVGHGLFAASQGSSQLTATFTSNTANTNTGNGIFFGTQGTSPGTVSVIGNTTNGNKVNTATAPFPSGSGIFVGAQESGTVTGDVNGNTTSNNGDIGIYVFAVNKGQNNLNVNRNQATNNTSNGVEVNVGLNGQPGVPAAPGDAPSANVQILANTITGNQGIVKPVGGGGLFVLCFTVGTVNAKIESNTITGNATGPGAFGGMALVAVQSGKIYAGIRKNSLFNNKGAQAAFTAASNLSPTLFNGALVGPSYIALQLQDNTSDSAYVLLRSAAEDTLLLDTNQATAQVVVPALPTAPLGSVTVP